MINIKMSGQGLRSSTRAEATERLLRLVPSLLTGTEQFAKVIELAPLPTNRVDLKRVFIVEPYEGIVSLVVTNSFDDVGAGKRGTSCVTIGSEQAPHIGPTLRRLKRVAAGGTTA